MAADRFSGLVTRHWEVAPHVLFSELSGQSIFPKTTSAIKLNTRLHTSSLIAIMVGQFLSSGSFFSWSVIFLISSTRH